MKYGIALGSNLGDRLEHLRQAITHLRFLIPGCRVLAASWVYETDPVDCPPGSPGFLNAVVELEIPLSPLDLLGFTRRTEADLGRPNEHGHHAPRTVDLDLLYAEDVVMNHPDLILPHPRVTSRRFVLEPLADIRPKLVLPGERQTIQALLDQLPPDEAPPRRHTEVWLPPEDRP